MSIEWKASELPTGTVISIYNIDHARDVPFYKDDEGDWAEIGSDNWEYVKKDYADLYFKVGFFKIVSLPPAWYEEFRPLPGGPIFIAFNRAGWIQYGDQMYTDPSTAPATFRIPFEEIVRKAFA